MKYDGKCIPPPEQPASAPTQVEPNQIAAGMVQLANKQARAAAMSSIAVMLDGLDGPDQQALPLSDAVVMEKARQALAKRQAIYGKDAFPDLSEKHSEP